jgi:hypothetical protein
MIVVLVAMLLTFPALIILDIGGAPRVAVLATVALMPLAMSDAAWDISALTLMQLVSPKVLERTVHLDGVPADAKTLVATSILLSRSSDLDEVLSILEKNYLSNAVDNTYFCLLTDFVDGHACEAHGERETLRRVESGIAGMNARYGEKFVLFHRHRSWNSYDEVWGGRERKRGKIEDLVSFLVDPASVTPGVAVGALAALEGVRYLITLDADTRLPRGAVQELVGTISHPTNRPVVDTELRMVIRGHAIVQPMPRTVSTDKYGSLLQRLMHCDGVPGLDYFQHVLGAGSYYGKGIVDVAAFHAVLKGRVPENTLLSHDLIEGCYLRSAISNHAHIEEEYPRTCQAESIRRRRWIRGDWQSYPWLFAMVPNAIGKERSTLSWLCRVKILDNMRRSLVAVALLATLMVGWFAAIFDVWTLAVLVAWMSSWMATIVMFMSASRGRPSFSTIVKELLKRVVTASRLPYIAMDSVESTTIALWRSLVSRKNMLEWTPSSEVNHQAPSIIAYGSSMKGGLCLSAAIFLYVAHQGFPPVTTVLCTVWLVGPIIHWALDQPWGSSRGRRVEHKP